MKLLRFLVTVVLFFPFCGAAPAQAGQSASPSEPPQVLVLVHQEFQFGRESERERLEAAIARACDQITVPNLWIVMQSVTGKPESLSFDPFDSYAHVDEAFAGWGQVYGSHPDLASMQEEVRAVQTSERTIIGLRRNDLSYQAGSIDLSKAHFMRVLEVQVRPGHDEAFVEAFKILRAAYLKIRADLPWVVYQVNVGMPSPTFLAFVPMRSLKQNDDLLAWRPLLREAEGDVASKRMDQIARESYLSSESNLYAIRPDLSHVSKEFAEGDPDFWAPLAAPPPEQKPESVPKKLK